MIVVDDGSTDATRETVASYRDRGVRYERLMEGTGAQAARNLGWRVAAHDWIAFQDSDDLWLPQRFELQIGALAQAGWHRDIVVHGNALRRDSTTGIDAPFNVPRTEGYCYPELLLRPAPLFQALLVSREALDKAGGLDETCPSYQEWDTAIRLAQRCRFIHITEPLFVWVWHGGEQISKDPGRALRGWSYVLDRYRRDFVSLHGTKAWRHAKLEQYRQAVEARLWQDAAEIVSVNPHPCFLFAGIVARMQWTPRGTMRILRWLAE